MKKFKTYLKFFLWFLFFLAFSFEFMKIVFEFTPAVGHQKLSWANASFWTSLLLIEMIMASMVLYHLVRHPARRKRLFILSLCHFSVILLFPTLFNDWSWTCVLYSWPHSLRAFDPATPKEAFMISLLVGFFLAPLLTYKWGMKGFCGYVYPHGAFFSETYGRVFTIHPIRFAWAKNFIPPFFYPDGMCPDSYYDLSRNGCAHSFYSEICLLFYCRVLLLCDRRSSCGRALLLSTHLSYGVFHETYR